MIDCARFLKAMEFAITVSVAIRGTDDSWLPSGAGSFLFRAAYGALSVMPGE